MKVHFYILPIVWLLSLVFSAQAQTDDLDVVLEKLKTETNDSVRAFYLIEAAELCESYDIKKYVDEAEKIAQKNLALNKNEKYYSKIIASGKNNLGFYYEYEGEFEKAVKCFQEFLIYSKKIADKKEIANTLNSIGYIYSIAGQPDSAIEYNTQSLLIREQIGDKSGISQTLNNMGNLYQNKGDIPKAIEVYQKSLKIREALGDTIGIANTLTNLGLIFHKQNEYASALSYYRKAIKYYIPKKDEKGIGVIFNNIAGVYQLQTQYDSALYYLEKSIAVRLRIKDYMGLSFSYNNKGRIFHQEKKYDEAEVYLEKALELKIKLNERKGEAIALCNLANIAYDRNNLSKSKKLALHSFAISQELMFPECIKNSAEVLKKIYEKEGNYAQALKMYELYVSMKDSINNEDTRLASIRSHFKYDFDKKSATDSIKNREERKIMEVKLQAEKNMKNYVSAGLIIFILISFLLWNRFSLARKQRNVINEQKLLVEEKNYEITQSIQYAQKIQNALLPSEEIFKQSLPDSFVLFKPKDIVSGDYYWLSDTGKHLFYATADCTGHGVPGGFMSMLGISLLNEIIDEHKIEDCGEALTSIREKLIQSLRQAGDQDKISEMTRDGMDMVLIRIDKKTLQMQYAAANNSFYVIRHCEDDRMKQSGTTDGLLHSVRNDVLIEMQCDKMPVGIYHSEVKPFQTFTFQLQKGDIIYTYTDGYADQFGGEKGKKYTYKRLREKLKEISREPLEIQKKILADEFEHWKTGQDQIDDVCLIGVKI